MLNVRVIAANPLYGVAFAVALTFLILWLQRRQDNSSNAFLVRNALFAGALSYFFIYYARPARPLDEVMKVGPMPD